MDKIIDDNISKRITSLRFLLMVFVIFLHANWGEGGAEYINNNMDENPFIWVDILFRYTIFNSAVPIFFFFSSYLLFIKNDSYTLMIKKKIKTIVLPYLCWNCLAILFFLFASKFSFASSFFNQKNNFNVSQWNVLDYIKGIFGINLLIGQFWFIRDLIILFFLKPAIEFLLKRFPMLIFSIVSVLYVSSLSIYIISTSSLFYFILGYFAVEKNIDFFSYSDKVGYFQLVLLLIVEFLLCKVFRLIPVVYLTMTSCILLLKLSNVFIRNEKLYGKLKYLSGLSFFLYAVQYPFILLPVKKIVSYFIPLTGVMVLITTFFNAIAAITIGLFLGIFIKKIIHPAYIVLAGNRN